MKSKITELESNEKKVGTNDYSYLLTGQISPNFQIPVICKRNSNDNFLRTPCFLK